MSSIPNKYPDDLILETLSDQIAIGFDKIIRGRISKYWGILQNRLARPNTTHWIIHFIHALWDLGYSLWNLRNTRLHQTIHSSPSQVRLWTQQRVTKYYALYQSSEP